jgi:predicted membrane-bound mannosyltransferase
VVKFLIKSGADIFARNAARRTPRQEAEVTLERVDSDELATTIAFLRDEETRRFQQSTSLYSDVSDDDEEFDDCEEDEKEEPENEDVAKFLGVAKSSPDVQKAFKSLGLLSSTSKSKASRRVRSNHVTPLKTVHCDKKQNSIKNSTKHNSVVSGTTPKVRLTYDSGKMICLEKLNSKFLH